MLKSKLLHPEILQALGQSGHGSIVLIGDGNYPFNTGTNLAASHVYLNFMPGKLTATEVLEGLVSAIPVEAAEVMMPDSGVEAPIFAEFRQLLPDIELQSHERFAFYDRARSSNVSLVVATGGTAHLREYLADHRRSDAGVNVNVKKALIVQGGWQGHQPAEVAALFEQELTARSFKVTVSDTLDAYKDLPLETFDLIVPHWTMGKIAPEQLNPLLEAVKSGVGLAGVHGGMADAFREQTEYQFMVGGQWVAHPGNDGVNYTVYIDAEPNPIIEGLSDFNVSSEQYYMHVDPAIRVLATTRFGDTVMPVTWTKHYGEGRVFYCSLGHQLNIVAMPPVLEMIMRGMVWAARE